MSLTRDPDLIPVWADAAVFVGKTANPTRPTDIDADFDETWDNLGVLDGDAGVGHAREWDETELFGWGIGLYRIGRKNYKETRTFTCLESNATTRKIAFGTASTSSVIKVNRGVSLPLAFEFSSDLGRKERWFTKSPADLWIPNLDRNESDPAGLEVTARIFADGEGIVYERQFEPANGLQVVTITGSPSGGTFTLSYAGQTTTGLAYNAASSAVQTALTGLSTIGSGNASVTGSAGGPYSVTLTLDEEEIEALVGNGSGLTPSGGVTVS